MHAGNRFCCGMGRNGAVHVGICPLFPPPLIYIDIEVPWASATSESFPTELNLTIIALLFLFGYKLVASSKELNGNTANNFMDIV
jgi:hypothetical protein